MLIRVVATRAAVPRSGEGIASVHGEIEPEIAAMDGNRGFAMAVDRASGRYLGIAGWTDREALDASARSVGDLSADLARRLHGSEPSVEVFDVVLAHVLKPLRVGYWGRLVRLEVPAHDLDSATRRAPEVALALFEGYAGLAAVILLVDRAAGVLQSLVWFDRLPALRGSAARSRELHDLLVTAVPAVTTVEESEIEVVIAELPAPAPDPPPR
jgi:quinol monooxygenase YgiN